MNNQENIKGKDSGSGLPEEMKINPFKVPEGYFENLTDRVMDRISKETPIRQITRKRTIIYYAAAIAILALVVSVIYLADNGNGENTLAQEITVTPGDISYFLSDDLTAALLMDMALESYPAEWDGGYPLIPDSSVSSEEIMDYLIDQDIFTNEIITH